MKTVFTNDMATDPQTPLARKMHLGERSPSDLTAADLARLAAADQAGAPDGYRLPPRWTWVDVAIVRYQWTIDARRFPILTYAGGTAWATPDAADLKRLATA